MLLPDYLESEFAFARFKFWEQMSVSEKSKIEKICNHYNSEPEIFVYRVHSRMSILDALTIPCSHFGETSASIIADVSAYDKCEYKTVTSICKKYKVSRATLTYRYNNKWPISEVLGIEDHFRPLERPLTSNITLETDTTHSALVADIIADVSYYDGCRYKSVSQICRKYSISRSTLYTRYNEGWPIDEMLGTKV